MSIYKGIIFDLDGVICSTDGFHYLAWKELADELGIYFDEKINNRLRGVSRMESLDIILENYKGEPLSADEKEKLAEKKNSIYKELLKQMTKKDLPDDVRQTLMRLRESGFKLAIGSSSKNTRFILERIGLKDFFDEISDGTNITRSKPDPEVFLKAAEFLGLAAGDCLVIEDAYAGIDAARAAGMDCVGIGDASGYDKATYRIKKMPELMDIVN